jgi:hypothetical protein
MARKSAMYSAVRLDKGVLRGKPYVLRRCNSVLTEATEKRYTGIAATDFLRVLCDTFSVSSVRTAFETFYFTADREY